MITPIARARALVLSRNARNSPITGSPPTCTRPKRSSTMIVGRAARRPARTSVPAFIHSGDARIQGSSGILRVGSDAPENPVGIRPIVPWPHAADDRHAPRSQSLGFPADAAPLRRVRKQGGTTLFVAAAAPQRPSRRRRFSLLAKPAIVVAISTGLAGPGPVAVPSANAAMMPPPSAPSLDAAVTPSAVATRLTPYSEGSSRIRYAGSWSTRTDPPTSAVGSRSPAPKAHQPTSRSPGWPSPGTGRRADPRPGPGLPERHVRQDRADPAPSSPARRCTSRRSRPSGRATSRSRAGTSGHPLVGIDTFTVRSLAPVVSTVGYPVNRTLAALATPSMSRPDYLVATRDPLLGTPTTRVSNTAGVRHSYARLSAWNSDESKILLGFTYPGRMLDGTTYARPRLVQPGQPGDLGQRRPEQAVRRQRQRSSIRQNATTGARTTMHTFTAVLARSASATTRAGSSDNDTYVGLIGTTSSGAEAPDDLQHRDRTRSSPTSPPRPGWTTPRSAARATTSSWSTTRTAAPATASSATPAPRRAGSTSTPYGRHGDNALDAAGNEIYVSNNAPYVTSFRLSNGVREASCSPGPPRSNTATSRDGTSDRPGWVYLSVFDNSITAGTTGHDQVIAVKTDGSGTVEVFAFSASRRTRRPTRRSPRPSRHRDGRRVLFASEWGTSSVSRVHRRAVAARSGTAQPARRARRRRPSAAGASCCARRDGAGRDLVADDLGELARLLDPAGDRLLGRDLADRCSVARRRAPGTSCARFAALRWASSASESTPAASSRSAYSEPTPSIRIRSAWLTHSRISSLRDPGRLGEVVAGRGGRPASSSASVVATPAAVSFAGEGRADALDVVDLHVGSSCVGRRPVQADRPMIRFDTRPLTARRCRSEPMDQAFRDEMADGLCPDRAGLTIGSPMLGGELVNDARVQVALSMMNRHGLIAGATGHRQDEDAPAPRRPAVEGRRPRLRRRHQGRRDRHRGARRRDEPEGRRSAPRRWPGRSSRPATRSSSCRCRASSAPRSGRRSTRFGPLLLGKVLDLNETQTSILSLDLQVLRRQRPAAARPQGPRGDAEVPRVGRGQADPRRLRRDVAGVGRRPAPLDRRPRAGGRRHRSSASPSSTSRTCSGRRPTAHGIISRPRAVATSWTSRACSARSCSGCSPSCTRRCPRSATCRSRSCASSSTRRTSSSTTRPRRCSTRSSGRPG